MDEVLLEQNRKDMTLALGFGGRWSWKGGSCKTGGNAASRGCRKRGPLDVAAALSAALSPPVI